MIVSTFPALSKDGYQIQSPPTLQYNCIAWAAGKDDLWWWPEDQSFWPPNIPQNNSLKAFIAMFSTMGYQVCECDESHEDYEKVAIYAINGQVQHAARQLENGNWTSKLGPAHDIEHTLKGLEGNEYGQVVCMLCRPRSPEPN